MENSGRLSNLRNGQGITHHSVIGSWLPNTTSMNVMTIWVHIDMSENENDKKGNDGTDIHRPDRVLTSGEKVGYADRRSRIRRRDGIVFKGDEIGYVDEQNQIRKPDGIILKGEVVGQIKDDAARARDGIIFPGEEWGYVDDDGNIRVRDSLVFRGRIIGKMRGRNKAAALAFFVLKFTRLQERCDELERDVRSSKNPESLLGKVRHMLGYLPQAEALGDFDRLSERLHQLEGEIAQHQGQQRSLKEALCERAENLSHSTDWKSSNDALKELQREWKAVGSTGPDESMLGRRFRAAQDRFFERRKEHFERQESQRQRNRTSKENLCSRAESLSSSSDWKSTSEALTELQQEWKVGYAGREYGDNLWKRFRHAQDRFFERQKAHFDESRREERENLHRKEELCSEAESLAHSDDYRSATQRAKELQQEWKELGPVPRDHATSVWNRFRHACDRVFEHAHREHERRQHEWHEKMREALERKREQAQRLRDSIEHDESNIDRWQDTINNLHPGGRADEIQDELETKISDVEDRITSKRERLEELEEAIRDIESKLDG